MFWFLRMKSLTKEFERRVAAFLRRTGFSPSEFGARAVGDRSFLGDLRRGRSPKLVTVDRVLAFMADWDRARGPERSSGDSSVEPGREGSGGNTQRSQGEEDMRTLLTTVLVAVWTLTPTMLLAQGTSPWVEAVEELQTQFTGPIARGLSLIAIVVGGLMFAFGEGGSKRTLAGIIFGIGMAMGAVNFLTWLF